MSGIKKHRVKNCAKRRLPEVAMASAHYLMFRCPDGCDQNASIEFVDLENIGDGEGVFVFNLKCPKCKKGYHYKIHLGPFGCHTVYGMTWKEQVDYWEKGGYSGREVGG